MTLTEKIYAVLQEEHSFDDGPLAGAGRYPHAGGECLTAFELDCRDWGFVYGLAYGIARGEDPHEQDSSVCERASTAARDAYTKWGGDAIFTTVAFRKDRAERPVPTSEAVA
jgi:hypothetical protein